MARSKLLTMAILRANIRNKSEQLERLKANTSGRVVFCERERLEKRRSELGAKIDVIDLSSSSAAEDVSSIDHEIDMLLAKETIARVSL